MFDLANIIFAVMCESLDRYMRRLSQHPAIQKDPNFRLFLQEVKLSGQIKMKMTIGRAFTVTHSFRNLMNR